MATTPTTSGESRVSLEIIVGPWPIAINLSQHLPVGDLISLARTTASLRAALHGFESPEHATADENAESGSVRNSLYIGRHRTAYWQKLKEVSSFLCSSKTHTKGPQPKPCRYCSRPICEACIVRSSFARGNENTFKNRCRYFCKPCWDSGNVSRTQRLPLNPSAVQTRRQVSDTDGSTKDCCTCTLKKDGWLCLECKDKQNAQAVEDGALRCHGEGCGNDIGEDFERRRVCLWCDKTLPRQIGGATRYVWNQKMIEARARNAASRQADLEEYNRRRLKLMRMSRREMRGDEAVKGDPQADLPQFVRHLDTVNYRQHMSESAAPSGDAVYASKMGFWRYNRDFLLHFYAHKYGNKMPVVDGVTTATMAGASPFARTNLAKRLDWHSMNERIDKAIDLQLLSQMQSITRNSGVTRFRLKILEGTSRRQWWAFKAVILDLLVVQHKSLDSVQYTIREEYGFDARLAQYRFMLDIWGFSLKDLYDEDKPGAILSFEDPKTVDSDSNITRCLQEGLDYEIATALPPQLRPEQQKTSSVDTAHSSGSTQQILPASDPSERREAESTQDTSFQATVPPKTDEGISSSDTSPSLSCAAPAPAPAPVSHPSLNFPSSANVPEDNELDITSRPLQDETLAPPLHLPSPASTKTTPTANPTQTPPAEPPPYMPGGWVWLDDNGNGDDDDDNLNPEAARLTVAEPHQSPEQINDLQTAEEEDEDDDDDFDNGDDDSNDNDLAHDSVGENTSNQN